MLVFLVLLIVLILLFGASAMLGAIIGILGWILGIAVLIAFLVWGSTTFGVDPSVVMLALVVGIPCGLFAMTYFGYLRENKDRPASKKLSFQEYWKEQADQ